MSSDYLCDAANSCLLIIDIQEKLTAAMPQKVTRRIISNTGILLQAAGRLEVPVITTAQYPQGLGAIEQAVLDKTPAATRHFEKTRFSCLGVAGFSDSLTRLGKKQIILMGIEAHICILQSAFELSAAGYHVFTVIDGIASRKAADYESAITRMDRAGIHIVNTESVLFEWLADAAHPDFKALSKLILQA